MPKEMDLDHWFRENPDWRPYADLVIRPPSQEEIMQWYPGDVSSEVLSKCYEVVTDCGCQVTRGAVYVRVRKEENTGDKWAAMLALNAFPGIQTTDTFWAGRKHFSEVFGNQYADKVRSELAKRGVNMAGKEYMPELARFPYDPEAVVPFDGARSYIKSVCKRRGWSCHGATNVDGREPESDPHEPAPMSDKMVREKARMMASKDRGIFKGKSRGEVREIVSERFGPSKTSARDSL